MPRLRPETRLVARQFVEREAEDLGYCIAGGGPHLVHRHGMTSSRAIEVKVASSRPHAVIHSVNGDGSRSTLSA